MEVSKLPLFLHQKSDISVLCKQLKTLALKTNRNEANHSLPTTLGV